MDEVAKPALYAAAGIPRYWVVKTDGGVVVHSHRLDRAAGVYRTNGIFRARIATTEPWPVVVSIKRLTPRYL